MVALGAAGQQLSQQLKLDTRQSESLAQNDAFFFTLTGSARQVPARQTACSVLGSWAGLHKVRLHPTTPQFRLEQSS